VRVTVDPDASKFRRTYKASDQTLDDNMKKLIMLQALYPQYSYLIRIQNPNSITDIIKLAKQLEVGNQPIFNPIQQVTTPFSSSFGPFFNPQPQSLPTGFPNPSNTNTTNKPTKGPDDMDIDEITEGLRKLQIENTEIKKLISNKKPVYNNNNRTQRFEPRKNNYNNYNNRSKDNNTCFTCGRPGHYARDCYQNQPRRDNNPPNKQTNNRRLENR